MLKNYKNDLIAIATIFGLISYSVYVCAAPAKATTKPVAKSAVKEVKKPAGKEVTPAPKADPNRKKPTLKKKYADKK